MITLTPSAVWTALTNLMPVDGVDLRSAASLQGLFQACVNRLQFLYVATPSGATIYATFAALVAAEPASLALDGQFRKVRATGGPDQLYICYSQDGGTTWDWGRIQIG